DTAKSNARLSTSSGSRTTRSTGATLLVACVLLAFAAQTAVALYKGFRIDDRGVVLPIVGLLDHGVYADTAGDRPEPGRRIALAYPALVAALAMLDPRMADAIRCVAARKSGCYAGNPFRWLLIVQALIAMTALLAAFIIAWELSHSGEIAALTMLLMLLMG